MKRLVIIACLTSVGALVAAGLWLQPGSGVRRIHVDGTTSYYVYSGTEAGRERKLPAIIVVGHPLSSPLKDLATFKDKFGEPVVLIWSGLLCNLPENCHVEDETVWADKRQQFLTLLGGYKARLPIDEDRIYLTGFSFAGVYSWMLAYDRPDLYAGVVPMSATSYPHQIQEHLDAARAVATIWVRGEKDDTPPNNPAVEVRTGAIVESCNARSRFVLKPGEGHRDMHHYWLESLQYAVQFRRNDGR
jgi:pimeloyl-ACP methyl ester carboxylesterase